jgi:hypothetical protein
MFVIFFSTPTVVKLLHENSSQYPSDVIKTKKEQLKNSFDALVIGETDSLSHISVLRYFSIMHS